MRTRIAISTPYNCVLLHNITTLDLETLNEVLEDNTILYEFLTKAMQSLIYFNDPNMKYDIFELIEQYRYDLQLSNDLTTFEIVITFIRELAYNLEKYIRTYNNIEIIYLSKDITIIEGVKNE